MSIPFYKIQGAGNDFILIDNQKIGFSSDQLTTFAARVCARRLSVGADTLIAIESARGSGDFYARFFNADGSEAEMCGNGARCVARWAYETGIAKEKMIIETIAGDVPAERLDTRTYRVKLNSPTVFEAAKLIQVDGKEVLVDYVELGDPGIPHLVVHIPDLAMTELEAIFDFARKLRNHTAFEKGANVNFYDILPDQTVVERTYERGVEDFTLACGTGTGSTAYALTKKGLIKTDPVVIEVLGGQLQVNVVNDDLYLIGDTNLVSNGTILDEDLN
ncbi:diaminopimelate epimerase [Enterococcus xiangfangensis]|uniref:Diaminopimelate epimerase n=1 Tax=Enterococcus xiangfangensis TaxID=1296537 RepID=A0ABU3FAE1_9ENTE|nr:diaminopimelate epimerase [Enterococcus xiangfangensis]MBM7710917.1 diaminopimelate epimerase [Enterococcus xiangfangensis]MDT2759022.1 diaminopimelate epimerase [Enterococcus xiangfangensis]NBK07882.1 diaminopimelate epimerase [Enterococcus asini]